METTPFLFAGCETSHVACMSSTDARRDDFLAKEMSWRLRLWRRTSWGTARVLPPDRRVSRSRSTLRPVVLLLGVTSAAGRSRWQPSIGQLRSGGEWPRKTQMMMVL
ncbi:uncharacterized protein LOC144162080 [Haemaphysalis longicornis]